MSVEDKVAAELRRKVEEAKGSFFPPVGRGMLEGHARIEDVVSEKVSDRPPTYVHEFRSRIDERPRLDVSNKGNLYDWLRENAGGQMLPGLYRRDGQLVRVPRIGEKGWIPPSKEGDDDGPAQVRSLNTGALVDIVQHRFWPYVEKVDKTIENKEVVQVDIFRTHTLVPSDTCRLAIDGATEWHRVPVVRAVSHTPTLRADGTLINTPGYDASGVLYLPDNALSPLDHPLPVTPEWVSWARDTINYVLRDFPFEKPGHKANMIALLVTPLIRRVIPPPYPMFLLNAHQRGTGKSLLAKIGRTIHGGIHRPDMPTDDEELRKQITSILTTTTAPLVNWDNSTAPIRSGQIANLLTTDIWSDRPLGRTDTVEATNDRVWMVTGNNIRIGGDMARRVQWISLDARVPKPEYRTGFAEKDLVSYVKQNRGSLVTALLVIALWWVQQGMPIREMRSDDYARWAGGMAEILDGAELGEGFGAGEAVDEELSEDEQELEMLLAGLELCFGLDEFTVADVRREHLAGVGPKAQAIDDALPSQCRMAKDMWKSVGRYLLSHEKTFAGKTRVIKMRRTRAGIVWRISYT